jgi:MFS family permease
MTVPIPEISRWQQTFIALRYPNFRLWFFGQVISLFGTWMQNTAQGYLIYELTRSPAFLGYVGVATGLPSWIFMLYGGVIADRISRRTMMITTQATMMVLAFILASLVFTSLVQPWHILVLAFGLGVTNAFDAPARLALIPELVDRQDLTNAIALNGTMFNLATIIGPAVGGIVYAAFGPGWCFTINGITFLAVITALLLMKLSKPLPRLSYTPPLQDMLEGFRFVARSEVVRALLIVLGVTTLFGFSFVNLLPAWAVGVLGGDATTNGWLRSAQGIGALSSALLIASLGRFNYRGKLLSIGTFAFPCMLLVFSLIKTIPFSLLAIAGVGGSVVLIMNLANSLVQGNAPDEIRGRVMSIYSLTFFGSMPIGAFLIGQIAEHTSATIALQAGAISMIFCASLIFILSPRVRKLE